jgi:hypothetical protein
VIALYVSRGDRRRCICPACGCIHFPDPSERCAPTIRLPVRRIGPTLRKDSNYHEAVRQSRLLSIAPAPERIIRRLDVPARDPRRVHLSRCLMRRPRLSLLERVRDEMSRRRA